MKKYLISLLAFFTLAVGFGQTVKHNFRIRTITAGITLTGLADTTSIIQAISFLKQARSEYVKAGYEVQTIRISTQNFYEYLGDKTREEAIAYLQKFDQIAKRESIPFSIGSILPPDVYDADIAEWALKLISKTDNINRFSILIKKNI